MWVPVFGSPRHLNLACSRFSFGGVLVSHQVVSLLPVLNLDLGFWLELSWLGLLCLVGLLVLVWRYRCRLVGLVLAVTGSRDL
jgi:hypothetical protein